MKKLILFFIFTTITLQSCIIVGIGRKPRWNYSDNSRDTISNQSKNNLRPNVSVEFAGRYRIIVVPFVLITWDNKNYGIILNVSSKKNSFRAIESVTFTISNLKDSILNTGIYKQIHPFSKFEYKDAKYKDGRYDVTHYYNSIHTDYNIRLPKKEQENDLKINFTLNLLDHEGKLIVYKYNYILLRSQQDKWLEAGSFF